MNDRLTNAEKATRYTAVFEFEGQPPAVHVACGWLGGRLVAVSFEDELARIDFADALLAAAGEKDGGDPPGKKHWFEVAMRQIDEIDAINAKIAACERERDALKRRLEPLTLKEVGGVNNPIIYGSRPLTGDEITAIVADADHIRARRA